jgi:hypothetical protein
MNARNHEESDFHYIVQTFGTPEWKSASIGKYGEHPLIVQGKKWQDDKKEVQAGLRNTVIFLVILGLLALWNIIRNLIEK